MEDGDVVVFMNFRADRARQMTRALDRPGVRRLRARARAPARALRLPDELRRGVRRTCPSRSRRRRSRNGFGEYLARRGLTQLRIAETEKYAHVTYFFNGGVEAVYPGEDRILVPSPKVATYDLKPRDERARGHRQAGRGDRARGKYDAIVCNYANGDMVGHTGIFEAAMQAVETLDACVGRVVAAARAAGGEVLITADHGNAETMLDAGTGQPHTAHTLNVVPFLYVGRRGARAPAAARCRTSRPTLLAMMGLPQPRRDDRALDGSH